VNDSVHNPASTSEWHVDPAALRAWVDGVAGAQTSISVEQHVQRCAPCRANVAALVATPPLEQVWDNVLTAVEVPRPGPLARLLMRMGVNSADALVIASAAALRFAWVAGVIAVLSFAELAQLFADAQSVSLFLAVAPLVPVAGVAAAYGPSVDSSYELVQAAPYAMVRLILLRTAAILIATSPLTVVIGLLMPAPAGISVTWLLPAAGFIAIVLTASVWIDPVYAAGVVGIGWLGAVLIATRDGDALAVLSPDALIGYSVAGVAAALLLTYRLVGSVPSWRLR